MTLVLTLLVLAVAVAVALVAMGRITASGMDAPVSSLPARLLPDGEIAAADVERVRLSPALRGYRMEEVDTVLDRVVAEISRRDEVIAHLRRRLGDDLPVDPSDDLPDDPSDEVREDGSGNAADTPDAVPAAAPAIPSSGVPAGTAATADPDEPGRD